MTVFRYLKKQKTHKKNFLQKCLIFKRLGTESSRNPAKLYSPLDTRLVVSLSEVLISLLVLFSCPESAGEGCWHFQVTIFVSTDIPNQHVVPPPIYHFHFIYLILLYFGKSYCYGVYLNLPANTIDTNICPTSILKRRSSCTLCISQANQNTMPALFYSKLLYHIFLKNHSESS